MYYLTVLVQAIAGFGALAVAVAQFRTGRVSRAVAGTVVLLAAIAMLATIAVPFLAFFVSVALALVMIVVLIAPRGGATGRRIAVAVLVAALAVGGLQPLGLKVLALPKADALPLASAHAKLVKTYGPGMWFEGVGFGPGGKLYLAENAGENYAVGDKTHVHAQVIERSQDGSERVFFRLPVGATAGVMTFTPDGTMYMTGTGAALGIWRIAPNGTGTLFAPLPHGAWPNGIALGPDGKLYVADSNLGTIWRIDPQSGATEKTIESDALRARPYIALAPGANGLHFFGRDLFVTVSDKAWVLKYRLGADGRFAEPVVVARGIPGDDFAIDAGGSLYVTTHPYNTLVRVEPDGRRTTIANATQGIVGATDAVFGVGPNDRSTLYVVTDGGAFSGNANAAGTLVTVDVPHR